MKSRLLIGAAVGILLAQGCASVRSPAPAAVRTGVSAAPQFATYGKYLKGVVTTVQKRWDSVLERAERFPPPDSYVVVKFVLAADGTIARISGVTNHSSRLGERYAIEAITQSAPFAAWYDDMKAQLNPAGEELVFTFYYK